VNAFKKLGSFSSIYTHRSEKLANNRYIEWFASGVAVGAAGLVLIVTVCVVINPWNKYSEDLQCMAWSGLLSIRTCIIGYSIMR